MGTPGNRKPTKFRLSMHIIDRDHPELSDWWIRWRGRDFFVKNVDVQVPMTTKIKRTQPIGVMEGVARMMFISADRSSALLI